MKTKLQMIKAYLSTLLSSEGKHKYYEQAYSVHKRELERCKEELKQEEERIDKLSCWYY
jgi:hypothetical protein